MGWSFKLSGSFSLPAADHIPLWHLPKQFQCFLPSAPFATRAGGSVVAEIVCPEPLCKVIQSEFSIWLEMDGNGEYHQIATVYKENDNKHWIKI